MEALTIKRVFISLCFPERISLQRSWNDFVEAGASWRLLLVCVKRRSTKGKLRKSKQCECCRLRLSCRSPLCMEENKTIVASSNWLQFILLFLGSARRAVLQAVITPSLLSLQETRFSSSTVPFALLFCAV